MSGLKISLLGNPQINVEGRSVIINRRKVVALIAYLAVTGRPHTREQLAALLWPENDRESAFAYLRHTIWELNQSLGKGWIEAEQEYVSLVNSADVWLDTAVFRKLTTEFYENLDALNEAVSLYRAEFLMGFNVSNASPFEEWQRQETEFFRREFARALDLLAEVYADRGEFTIALDFGRRLLTLDPINENAHRLIMRLLAGMGDRVGAIRQYEDCAEILKRELDIQPQLETAELYEAICREDIRAVVVKRTELSKRTMRLPSPLTPFIGRQTEAERIKSFIVKPDYRLISLIGPGGAGKTRLAIQVVSEVVHLFADGVVFISLAQVQWVQNMISVIAKGLDFSFYREQESTRQQLLNYLGDKELLLILDNFEHLIGDGARRLVTEMLTAGGKTTLLVTSRERLNMPGEQVYRVVGMTTPEPSAVAGWTDIEKEAEQFSAVQLFVERARRIQPDFTLKRENLPDIARICQLVDGLPLGLELAAAWLEVMPPAEIATEINHSLDFLETGQAGIPERQRSMKAVFESSWRLLTADEQRVFKRLSVFAGPFSRDAAEFVGGASLRLLLGLANKSWLQQTEDGRFQLHEFLRQYGLERLQEIEADWVETKNLHASFYSELLAKAGKQMRGPGQETAVKTIAQEFGSNIQAAWNWLVLRGQWQLLVNTLLPVLFHFGEFLWMVQELVPLVKSARLALEASMQAKSNRDHQIYLATLAIVETEQEFDQRISEGNSKAVFLKTWDLVEQHSLAEDLGFWYLLFARRFAAMIDYEKGVEQQRKAISLLRQYGNRWDLAFGLYWMGAGLVINQAYDEGEQCLKEALHIFKGIESPREQAEINSYLGNVFFRRDGDLDKYNHYQKTAQTLYESVGDQFGVGCLRQSFAIAYSHQGQHDKSFDGFRKQRKIYEVLGNRRLMVDCLSAESLAASRYSTLEHAFETRQKALDISVELGIEHYIAWNAWELGEVYRLSGNFSEAEHYYERASLIFEKLDINMGKGVYHRGFGDIALAQWRLEEAHERFLKYYAHAACEKPFNNWAMAYAQAKLGRIAAVQGDLTKAENHIKKAAELANSWDSAGVRQLILLSQVFLMVSTGENERAVELATFIENQPTSWNETKQEARLLLNSAASYLSQETVQAAVERGLAFELEAVLKANN